MTYRIAQIESDGELAQIGKLFRQYADWLQRDHNISLEFQNFEAELAGLPGTYVPPNGALLLASDDVGGAVGCIGLRPYDDTSAEIKRLYVAPEARGTGLGRTLVERILDVARSAGYQRAVLDTGPFMQSAQALYRSLNFVEIPAYYQNP
ncbi:MAG: GNAT family N-acetyltransferase, partial [Pseudomonadota bacterium]